MFACKIISIGNWYFINLPNRNDKVHIKYISERNEKMSLELVKEIFQKLPDCKNWSAHLLGFKHSIRNGTVYNCRKIELEPSSEMDKLIQSISELYVGEDKHRISKYTDIREYDGTCNGTTIYKISENNSNVEIDLAALFQGIADSDTEADPLEMKSQAYVLCGCFKINNEEHRLKMISMNTPVTLLNNRFMCNNGKFWAITEKVLHLRTIMNVLIYDKTVYFLDMSGETLFNMERAYKLKCSEVVNEIETMNIVSDIEIFKNTATTGANPRRFAAFSKSKLQLLKKKKNREKAAKYFNIPLTEDKKQFNTTEKVDAENLVKLLCGKAMWDIMEEVPVEVDGSKSWTR